MKKFHEIVMRDIGWKLLSVVIAVTLWFMVINIEHPVDTRTYMQTIKFENEDQLVAQGLTIRGRSDLENMKVSIKVKAQRTSLDRLSQYKGNIKATVDLQKAVGYENGETLSLPVEIKLPEVAGSSFEIVNKTPQTVELTIEDLISRRQKVEPILSGSLSSGYLFDSATVTPETVTVTGARSIVETVTQVRANVNLDGLDNSTNVTVTPEACDATGNVVKGVAIAESQVTVRLNIGQSKKVALVGNAIGIPASGYAVGAVTVTPQTIELQGSSESLINISEIHLPDVDVYDAARSVTKSYAVKDILPAGLTLKGDSPASIQVRVEIKPEGRGSVSIPTSSITGGESLAPDLAYTFDSDTISIDVQRIGQSGIVSPSDVTASADFTNITDPGKYTLRVNVILPPGFTLAGIQPTVSVTVTQEASQTPAKPPEEAPDVPLEPPAEEDAVPEDVPADENTGADSTESL